MAGAPRRAADRPGSSDRPGADFVVEVVAGLESFAAREVADLGAAVRPTAGELRFRYVGPWPRLLGLRTITAVHAVAVDSLPRPRALLADGTVKRIVAVVGHVRALHRSGAFGSVRLSAAGAGSPRFQQVRERLAALIGLPDVETGGDLLMRFARASHGSGFELTVRISPRPLSARPWRVCNLPGALNASVASVMAALTAPASDDTFLNLACGSGTLLVERAALGPVGRLVGCDTDAGVLACAGENLAAAGLGDLAELRLWDATAVPLPNGWARGLVADLPFGQLMGSHTTNERLYPTVLAEAARLATPGAHFVAITQQVNLFERCLRETAGAWVLEREIRLHLPANAGVLKPRIYTLRRSA